MLGGVGDRSVMTSLSALGACPLVVTGMDNELLFASARARVESLSA